MSLFGLSYKRSEHPPEPAYLPSVTHCHPTVGVTRQPTCDLAVFEFALWLSREQLTGEREWRRLWALYRDRYCVENDVVPVPDRMKAYFAEALSTRAQRGQVRMFENGKMRRITTYTIIDQTTEWA